MLVVTPASTSNVPSVAAGGRLAGAQHVDRHGAGDGVALLVVDGVGERGRAGEVVVRVERHGQRPGAAVGGGGGAAALVVAAREEEGVAVGVDGGVAEVER